MVCCVDLGYHVAVAVVVLAPRPLRNRPGRPILRMFPLDNLSTAHPQGSAAARLDLLTVFDNLNCSRQAYETC
jgi:hypothetical protein